MIYHLFQRKSRPISIQESDPMASDPPAVIGVGRTGPDDCIPASHRPFMAGTSAVGFGLVGSHRLAGSEQ
jgi:hypothetical protein